MLITEQSKWVTLGCKIDADIEDVWKILIQPEYTQYYMYNCQLHSDWTIGSDAVWKQPMEDGNFIERVRAKVLKFKPPFLVGFRVFHELDKGEICTSELYFKLSPLKKQTELIICQGDFNTIPQSDQLYEQCKQGWVFVIPKLIATCNQL